MRIAYGLQRLMGCILPTYCNRLHTTANTEEKCWELLRLFARSFITDLKTILSVARLRNKESLALESEIQLTESGIQLTIGVRNPSFY